ncbi:hypothetical protein E4U21_006646 [Claviceps maximensis]|nr:hypothetical protein E4U21_006646 [Claviceps maximensis]
MLGRMVASPSHAITTRAFSSAMPVRFSSNKPSYNDTYNNTYSQPVRLNPLVGNVAPVQPTPPTSKTVISSSSGPSPSPRTPVSEPDPDTPMPPFTPPPPPPPPSTESTDEVAPPKKPQTSFAYNATDDHSIVDIADIISDKASKYGSTHGIQNPLDRPNVRTKAVVGRTVFIKDRLAQQSAPTATVAIRVLDRLCRDQKIKNKYHSQKFHERKGLKKKRLTSQRWRARFKTGFKAAVNRVLELKRQGW